MPAAARALARSFRVQIRYGASLFEALDVSYSGSAPRGSRFPSEVLTPAHGPKLRVRDIEVIDGGANGARCMPCLSIIAELAAVLGEFGVDD